MIDLVDDYVAALASALTGELSGNVGVVPQAFAKELVGGMADRVDQLDDFRSREHYTLAVTDGELTVEERSFVE